jgi:hypothetical protein
VRSARGLMVRISRTWPGQRPLTDDGNRRCQSRHSGPQTRAKATRLFWRSTNSSWGAPIWKLEREERESGRRKPDDGLLHDCLDQLRPPLAAIPHTSQEMLHRQRLPWCDSRSCLASGRPTSKTSIAASRSGVKRFAIRNASRDDAVPVGLPR